MNISQLLEKYNVPGPRYTSYPTVPYWETSPTEDQWISSVARSLEENEHKGVGAALYVHIPFCRALCTYCGCNTRVTRSRGVVEPYIKTLIKEWDYTLNRLGRLGGSGPSVSLTEFHMGGGTPTFLEPAELEILLDGLFSKVKGTTEHEFSFEADPRVTSKEQIEVFRKFGFKRISLGIQDFDPKVQDIVHRVQSEEEVRRVTDDARELGFTGVNYDLIYGLPFQTVKSIEDTMEIVCRLRPDRIAFYGYAHVPWIKPGQRRFTEDDLPNPDAKRALYETGRRLLAENGYREIGMDHFALESDSLWKSCVEGKLHRNFMGYISRQVAPLIGLGVSSIGDSWDVFSQNEKLVETYMARVEKGELPIHRGHVLDEEDKVLRRHILNIMTRFKTDWSDSSLQTPYLESVTDRLSEFVRDGLMEVGARSCVVKPAGIPFLRNICMAFDARLTRKAPSTKLFSRTI